MYTRILFLMGAVTMSTNSFAAEEPVPAKLFAARGGLGNVFAKLKVGGEVRIAYFGGSITAAPGWRVKTLDWFRKGYPAAKITEISAAIGGTGSDLGVFRFRRDVLDHKPNLIFVEFAVNDGGAPPEQIYRTMEGIIRQAWAADPTIDLCFVYTLHEGFVPSYDRGLCPRSTSAHERLAEHYAIPSIDMAMRVCQLAREGKLIVKHPADQKAPEGKIVFCNDGCHPLDAGHEVYRDVIVDAMKEIEAASKAGPHALKPPFVPDHWQAAKLVAIEPWMLSPGWQRLDPARDLGKAFHDRLPDLWAATRPGEKMAFRFRGHLVQLYDLMGPDGGKAICSLDGKVTSTIDRFDIYCTYHRLAAFTVAESKDDAWHTVSVELSPDPPDREAVLKDERSKPGFDPKRYEGVVLRVGYVMVVGEVGR